jgi:hypothetical protein
MQEGSYILVSEYPKLGKATAIGDKYHSLEIEHPTSSTNEVSRVYRKKPKFVDKGYMSLVLRDFLKGKPLKGMQKAGIKFLYENSIFAKDVIENPGGEKALYDIYAFDSQKPKPSENGYTQLDKIFLGHLRACKGTRRRRNEYQNTLKKSIEELYETNGDRLNLIELGSGRGSISMQVIYDIIKNRRSNGDDLHLVLVDKDEEALVKAKEIAEANGLSSNVRLKRYNVKNVCSVEPHNNYHAVGTHGLMDYFPDEDGIKFLQDVGDILVLGGRLITTNMMPHDDWITKNLMEIFGNWWVKYRTPKEFRSLIEKSGRYEILDTKVVTDNATYVLNGNPWDSNVKGFHAIVTAKKKQ